MVVYEVHVEGVAVFKAEHDAPVRRDAYAPNIRMAIEAMQVASGGSHLARLAGFVEGSQDRAQAVDELGWQAARVIAFPEPARPSVLEVPNHHL